MIEFVITLDVLVIAEAIELFWYKNFLKKYSLSDRISRTLFHLTHRTTDRLESDVDLDLSSSQLESGPSF